MRIQRLAWAGIKVEVGAVTLFVDAVEGGPYFHVPPVPLSAETSERHALVTHAHTDHYDPAALARILGEDGTVICHDATVGDIARPGLHVRGVPLHASVFLNDLTADLVATAVPAADGWGLTQVSWVIDGGGRRIIHCGDTLWHGHWWDITRRFGPFDLAFLPINGVIYRRGRYIGSDIPATLTPTQAATAGHLLGARVVVPFHYGNDRDPEHYREQPDAEATFLREAGERGVRTHLLAPGAWLDWDVAVGAA